MDPRTTALLIIDDSNDFLTEGGKLHGALAPFLKARSTIERINEAVRAARAADVAIVRAPFSFSSDYREMGEAPSGVFATVRDAGGFIRGSWGAAPADVIDGAPTDLLVEGKHTLDAFASTKLDNVLRERSVKTLVVAGVLSNLCVSSTMRTAYDRGYEVLVLTDACAALAEAHHDDTAANDWPLFSRPVTTAAFTDSISS